MYSCQLGSLGPVLVPSERGLNFRSLPKEILRGGRAGRPITATFTNLIFPLHSSVPGTWRSHDRRVVRVAPEVKGIYNVSHGTKGPAWQSSDDLGVTSTLTR